MIEIGEGVILWRILKNYSVHGINDFVICCRYKGLNIFVCGGIWMCFLKTRKKEYINMAIGSYYAVISKNSVSKFVLKHFGTSDVHSHFRIKPLIDWAKENTSQLTGKTIVEVGCGAGSNVFEINGVCPEIKEIYGFDFNKSAIDVANKLKNALDLQKVHFFVADCTQHQFNDKIDVLLLVDFLEHINDPHTFLKNITKMLSENSVVVISVPTPLYPKVFGRDFHIEVGHVRNGFTIEELNDLLSSANLSAEKISYNTGLIASVICFIYYNIFYRIKGRPKQLLGYILSLSRFADWINSSKVSSSLFVVAKLTNRN